MTSTLATVEAGIPPCDCCDADRALCDIGEGVYVMEIRHDLGCLRVLACYEKG